MHTSILVLNSGSSSLKFAIYTFTEKKLISTPLYRGAIYDLDSSAKFTLKNTNGENNIEQLHFHSDESNRHKAALDYLLHWIKTSTKDIKIVMVGHRVIHGGNEFLQPTIVDDKVIKSLESYNPLAPLHQPYNIAGVRALKEVIPEVVQIACFDTMFHANLPELAQAFALPENISTLPIKRYGFHGLSYEYIAQVLPDYLGRNEANKKIIVAHLGHGASLCAMSKRESIATTMGFTALDGLMMATRCGSLDPGIILYLLTRQKMSVSAIINLLYERSGVLGVSGISGDIRELLHNRQKQAQKAVNLFVYHVVKEIGGLTAILNGVDHLVFTAGIGEHLAEVRSLVCQQLEWLGLKLDLQSNFQDKHKISTNQSSISVWVIPTNEELMIAQHTWRLKYH